MRRLQVLDLPVYLAFACAITWVPCCASMQKEEWTQWNKEQHQLRSRHKKIIEKMARWLEKTGVNHSLEGYAAKQFAPKRSAWSVDVVDDISSTAFLSRYQDQEPVIIREHAAKWPATKKWSVDYLSQTIASAVVQAAFQDHSEGWVDEILSVDDLVSKCAKARKRLPKSLHKHTGKWALIRPPMEWVSMGDVLVAFKRNDSIPVYVSQVSISESLVPLKKDLGKVRIRGGNVDRDLFMTNRVAITPLHYDDMDNFITVIKGIKEVILFPPQEKYNIYNARMVNLAHKFSEKTRIRECDYMYTEGDFHSGHCAVNELDPDTSGKHSRYSHANGTLVSLRPGETLYIPAGWFHAVRSKPDSEGLSLAVNGMMKARSKNWKKALARRDEL